MLYILQIGVLKNEFCNEKKSINISEPETFPVDNEIRIVCVVGALYDSPSKSALMAVKKLAAPTSLETSAFETSA